jgi:sulfur carrier protein ThiS adenylyltransferase
VTEDDTGESIFARNPPGLRARLSAASVAIAGCGGLGSNAAVALVRAGVGEIILADFDRVEPSNLNRQHFFEPDLGRLKVDALADHLRAIHPSVKLRCHDGTLTRHDVRSVFGQADLLIEAFDDAASKAWLIEAWTRACPGKPVISGNGLAGMGAFGQLTIRQAGPVHFCGDGQSDASLGLVAPRVAIVANMQALLAIELLAAVETEERHGG